MRGSKILIALILGCALAAPAYALPDGLEGIGEVQLKNMVDRTLTIDGRVYTVTAQTQLRDPEGHAITLAAIDAPQSGEEDNEEWMEVAYTAVETIDGFRLTSLEMMNQPAE